MPFRRLSPDVLGVLGLIPFAALAIGVYASPPNAEFFTRALIYYGATILAFLGGVHWGVALPKDQPPAYLYISGVLPQLWAFAALFATPGPSLLLLAAGLLAILAVDVAYARAGFIPVWFLKLRLTLSAGATASLCAGFLAVSGGKA